MGSDGSYLPRAPLADRELSPQVGIGGVGAGAALAAAFAVEFPSLDEPSIPPPAVQVRVARSARHDSRVVRVAVPDGVA
jgi:hypothetical protein